MSDVRSRTIHIDISSASGIQKAIYDIELIQEKLRKMEEINAYLDKLSGYGVIIAQNAFNDGYLYNNSYGGDYGNVTVTATQTDNGFIIEAAGEQVLFMEFGAGVYYSGRAYEGERPEGIVGIGEYGKKRGKRKAWGYYQNGDKASLVITHGVPALQGMYLAKKRIMEDTRKFIQGVLND